MGDRVLFVFHGGAYGGHIAPAIYSHWGGGEAPDLLRRAGAAGILRRNDPSYAAARMCGFLHEQYPRETTGLGLFKAPADLEAQTLEDFSHGDAGVIVINVGDGSDFNLTEGKISYYAGYHAKTIAKEPGYELEEGEEPMVYPTTVILSE